MSFAPGWRGTNTIAQENEQMMGRVPRRACLHLLTSEEKMIHDCIVAIEKMPYAHTKLTMAQVKLQEAKDLLSDFVDGHNLEPFGNTE